MAAAGASSSDTASSGGVLDDNNEAWISLPGIADGTIEADYVLCLAQAAGGTGFTSAPQARGRIRGRIEDVRRKEDVHGKGMGSGCVATPTVCYDL